MTAPPLRDYQQRAVDEVVSHWRKGTRRVLTVAPTGAGKTRIGVELPTLATTLGAKRTVWLAHRTELIEQAAAKLEERGLRCGRVSPNHPPEPWFSVQVASIETLISRRNYPPAELLIWDECFPAETLVTRSDGRRLPIARVRLGDVLACGGEVVRTFARSARDLYAVWHEHGALRCTPNHPIYVKGKGYVSADSLVPGDLLCVWSDVPLSSGERQPTAEDVRDAVSLATALPDDGANEPQVRGGAHVRAQSDALAADPREGVGNAARDGSRAQGARWQRDRPDEHGVSASSCDQPEGRGSRAQFGNSDRATLRSADALQGGHRSRCESHGGRGGRAEPRPAESSGAGREEGSVARWSRVVRVEVLDLGRAREVEGVCADGLVYNLETARGCYVAGGVLVHNCHHSAAETYKSILEVYPHALQAGLTATPQRRDGKALGDHYDELVIAAQYSELLEKGHIVPCEVARPTRCLGSDLAQPPLAEWKAKGGNLQTFAFAPTVAKAHEWAAEFRAAGITSVAVDGTTPAGERAAALKRFRSGDLRVLWNVYVFSEGTDVPAAACCLLARGCGHSSTFLQIVGRVLRPAPGKTSARLLDLSGTSHKHGMPTADRRYSLTGRAIETIDPIEEAPPPVEEEALERKQVRIWDEELQWAIDEAGGDPAAVSSAHKANEWRRLRELCERRGFSLSWGAQQYQKLFGERPVVEEISDEMRRREVERLERRRVERNFKPGFTAASYRELFGRWPPRAWVDSARQKILGEMRAKRQRTMQRSEEDDYFRFDDDIPL